MFFVIFDIRSEMYFVQKTSSWTPHFVCATFFDYLRQAEEIVNNNGSIDVNLLVLHETEDLSAARIDIAVDHMVDV